MPIIPVLLAMLLALVSTLVADDNLPPSSEAKPTPADTAFFEEHIRPLLENRCYKCHSAQSTDLHANLYLDSRPGWQKGGDSGPAIVPHKPLESLLIQAIGYSESAATQMPPEGKLPATEIALLTKWVEMGAPDPRVKSVKHAKQRTIDLESESRHWAYQPLMKQSPPGDEQLSHGNANWLKSPIDRFVLLKLEQSSLSPNGPADKIKLIRRAYFDLIGLPPPPAAVDTFLDDLSPTAYEKVIDGLLDSPHYGERWGRHWLDLARFAESHGFEQDYDRPNAYHFRDFVIQALNNDMATAELNASRLVEMRVRSRRSWRVTFAIDGCSTAAPNTSRSSSTVRRRDEAAALITPRCW